MLEILDFNARHAEEAEKIALMNYNAERAIVTDLPHMDKTPPLTYFANNGLGVAAFEGEKMLGFLCAVEPFANAFGSTDATGVFSPMGANGAIGEKTAEVYARMYQGAGEKWVHAGASSHAVCLYAHDKKVQEKLFQYGFGIRCVDAIRPMEVVKNVQNQQDDIICCELPKSAVGEIRNLRRMLSEHMGNSPCFMHSSPGKFDAWIARAEARDSRIFVAAKDEQYIAFVEITRDGENFATEADDMQNVCGAICLPEFRGMGVFQNLINSAISKLKIEGYTRLGVDFESFNPAGSGFWLKSFSAYTKSVVRRIDESAIRG